MESTLSKQLQKFFKDIKHLQSLADQLSLHMFIDDATDETTAVFADVMTAINNISIPNIEFIFEDVSLDILNNKNIPRA